MFFLALSHSAKLLNFEHCWSVQQAVVEVTDRNRGDWWKVGDDIFHEWNFLFTILGNFPHLSSYHLCFKAAPWNKGFPVHLYKMRQNVPVDIRSGLDLGFLNINSINSFLKLLRCICRDRQSYFHVMGTRFAIVILHWLPYSK